LVDEDTEGDGEDYADTDCFQENQGNRTNLSDAGPYVFSFQELGEYEEETDGQVLQRRRKGEKTLT
jgi:hypothetical protein